jgi:hypothetical protein
MEAWLKVNWNKLAMATVMVRLGYRIPSTCAVSFPYLSSDHTVSSSYRFLFSGSLTVTVTVTETLSLFVTHLIDVRQDSEMQIVTQAKNTSYLCVVRRLRDTAPKTIKLTTHKS